MNTSIAVFGAVLVMLPLIIFMGLVAVLVTASLMRDTVEALRSGEFVKIAVAGILWMSIVGFIIVIYGVMI